MLEPARLALLVDAVKPEHAGGAFVTPNHRGRDAQAQQMFPLVAGAHGLFHGRTGKEMEAFADLFDGVLLGEVVLEPLR